MSWECLDNIVWKSFLKKYKKKISVKSLVSHTFETFRNTIEYNIWISIDEDT